MAILGPVSTTQLTMVAVMPANLPGSDEFSDMIQPSACPAQPSMLAPICGAAEIIHVTTAPITSPSLPGREVITGTIQPRKAPPH